MEPLVIEHVAQQLAWLLLGAALLGLLARRLSVPYEVALVLAALLVEESGLVAAPSLEPSVLLFLFLPPLLFDAAFRQDVHHVGHMATGILLLAVPGVLLTALAVGGILTLVLGLPLATALVFGSIVAATDPVAVVGVFRRLHVPGHLLALLEVESLANDGTAITLYTALVGIALAGVADPLAILTLFGRQVIGGILIGTVAALIFSRLTAATDDHLIEMTLSTALAYGSYLLAQSLDTSGALACVAAGLIHGSFGRASGMNEASRHLLDDLWEYLGFIANALVFLLLGFTVNLRLLLAQAWPVTVAIVAVFVVRALLVAGILTLPKRALGITPPEGVVLVWGGLRGALTASLALALPAATPGRDVVIAMAFGVVLFTLVVQGLTLPVIVRRAGLAKLKAL
ncbi:MAG: monovalent cation:H+ antiporter, family [Chloroflexota bacterium]|jgi:CPA1 family monovalent cation:H+ antiporter|nr:monovalent cation:H+ antiporter, family [Chloroflexota bacterium]